MAIVMALIAPAFVGAVGLSVETGYWFYIEDRAQAAADVSAHAGAMSMRRGNGHDAMRVDARGQATSLGYLGEFGGANSCSQLIGARVSFLGTADITSACAAAGINWASVPGAALLVE
jgi:Flp pilus assembly protein TadG